MTLSLYSSTIEVALRGEPERVPDQMQHTGLEDSQRPCVADHFGQSFESVADHDTDILNTAVSSSR